MRDLLIVSIVFSAALLALKRPWIGVMSWTWLSIMNPHRYSWGFAYSAPLAAVAAGTTLLGLLFTKKRRHPFQGAPTVWLALFAVWVTLSWQMGMDVRGDYPQWDKVMKIYLMTFVALMLIIDRQQIMIFAWISVGSMLVLAAKGGLFTILTAGNYRVWGPPGTFIGDNNHFALGTIIILPMLHFLQLQLAKPWHRHVMTVLILLCVATVLGSHSRGALLALGALGAVFWLKSEKKLAIAVVILVVTVVLLPMMPDAWWDRMGTIQTYEEDASAMGRINAWYVAIGVASNKVFGAGMSYQHEVLFFMYGQHETIVRAAHSIYFQILGNHGYIGLFLYLGIFISTFRTAGWLKKHAKGNVECKWAADLGSMVQVSLMGMAVGGAFLSMPYFDMPYNYMVLVVAARKWLEEKGWEQANNKMSIYQYARFEGELEKR